jgi:hypothetical protein
VAERLSPGIGLSHDARMEFADDLRPRVWLAPIGLAFLVLGLAQPGGALVIFDNFPAASPYYTVGDTFAAQRAASFVASHSGLASFDLALFHLFGPNEVTISFAADDEGFPGDILESFTFTGALGPPGPGLLTVNLSGANPINAGESYWIIATAPTDTFVGWSVSLDGPHPQTAFQSLLFPGWRISPLNPSPAFRVELVPEAAGLTLLGLGALGLRSVRRSRTCPAPPRSDG